jgi:hypothetical protein
MTGKIIYMCPVTQQGYDNPYEPRKHYLTTIWEPTQDEIFEYSALCDIIEVLKRGEEPDPLLLDMLKLK